ncbi:MAG: hypothetical protein EZS28_032260, partial [Streblomastix strix]
MPKYAQMMSFSIESTPDISNQRKDMIILENLALPGEITSAIVGHFLNRKQYTLILAKQTILSLFNYDADAGTFILLDHKPTFKQVFSIHSVPQQYLLDCIFIITVNGEGILLQWHENDFFPLGAGQILDAALQIMENPERRRFRIDPTYQFAVLIIPQDETQSTQFSKPNTSQASNQLETNKQQEYDSLDLMDVQAPIERVSFRAICIAEESVLLGLSYDGPGSDLMYDVSEKMDETLINIPQMCQWGDQYICSIENGLENVWRAKQRNKEDQGLIDCNKERVIIAHTQTFIFYEEGINEIINQRPLILDTLLRVRHADCTHKMQLQDFPFQSSEYRDHTQDNIASIYAIADTTEGVSLLSFKLDFSKQTMKLGSFAVIGLPSTSSRIIALSNVYNDDQKLVINKLSQQTLKGSEVYDIELVEDVKESNLLLALTGLKILNDQQDKKELHIAKKLQKLIRSRILKSKMLSIHIQYNQQQAIQEASVQSDDIISPNSSQSHNSLTENQTNITFNNNDSDNYQFVPYILASSKAIILQQSINKAFIFPFPNALPIPPFGFCHVYVEDRTELQLEQ